MATHLIRLRHHKAAQDYFHLLSETITPANSHLSAPLSRSYTASVPITRRRSPSSHPGVIWPALNFGHGWQTAREQLRWCTPRREGVQEYLHTAQRQVLPSPGRRSTKAGPSSRETKRATCIGRSAASETPAYLSLKREWSLISGRNVSLEQVEETDRGEFFFEETGVWREGGWWVILPARCYPSRVHPGSRCSGFCDPVRRTWVGFG